MGIRIITEPTTEPLTLSEAKAHLRVDGDDEDVSIGSLIRVARMMVERQCWRQLVTATLEWTRDEFPLGRFLYIPRPPLQSITSITYVDLAGQMQTLSSANYYVDPHGEPGRVMLKDSLDWPETNLQPGCVTVRFVAGRAASDVSADLKAAMLLIVGNLYANREGVITGTIAAELPMGVQALLAPHRFRDQRITEQLRQ